jgi:hypothetical protein
MGYVNYLEIFARALVPNLISSIIGLSFVSFLAGLAIRRHFLFVNEKSFVELYGLTGPQQKFLLREADERASQRFQWAPSVLTIALFWSFGMTLAKILPQVTAMPHSFLTQIAVAVPFFVVGGLIASRMQKKRVRRFLDA